MGIVLYKQYGKPPNEEDEEHGEPQNEDNGRFQKFLDGLGFSASTLCAIHCALVPILIASLPAMGLAWMASPVFGKSMVAFTAVVASWAIWMGFRKHNRCWPIGFLGVGLALLFIAEFVLHSVHNCNINPAWARLYPDMPLVKQAQHDHYVAYTVSFAGGILVAFSHVLNHYFHRSCHKNKCTTTCCHSENPE